MPGISTSSGISLVSSGISRGTLIALTMGAKWRDACFHIPHLWSQLGKIAQPAPEHLCCSGVPSLTREVTGACRYPGHLPSGGDPKMLCSHLFWEAMDQPSASTSGQTMQSAQWGGHCSIAAWVSQCLSTLPMIFLHEDLLSGVL